MYASTIIPTAAYNVGGTPAQFMARLERFIPTWMAANRALPDYTNRPSERDANDYVRAMFSAPAEGEEKRDWGMGELRYVYSLGVSPEYPNALEIRAVFGNGEAVTVIVWNEPNDYQNPAAGHHIYGEW